MGSQVSQVAFPFPDPEASKEELQSHPGLLTLETTNGLKIPAVHIRQRGANFTIIFSHGNAEDVGLKLPYLTQLSRVVNANVLAYEYAGYSIAEGKPSPENCYKCIDAALRYLCYGQIQVSRASNTFNKVQTQPRRKCEAQRKHQYELDAHVLSDFYRFLATRSEVQAAKLERNLSKVEKLTQFGPAPMFTATCEADLIKKLAVKYDSLPRSPLSETTRLNLRRVPHKSKQVDVQAWFKQRLEKKIDLNDYLYSGGFGPNQYNPHCIPSRRHRPSGESSQNGYLQPDDVLVPLRKIIIFGRSIGTGPSVDLASRLEGKGLGGLILMSPLESGIRAVMSRGASLVLGGLDIFCNYSKIHKVDCPTLIMHGTADTVVPFNNGKNLYDKLQNKYPPFWVEGVGHNNMPESQCFSHIRDFLQALPPLNLERTATDYQKTEECTTDWDHEHQTSGMLGCTS